MEPYRIDFAMMRGHELVLDREQPITREELDTMELQMLRSNAIPFLLPVEWIEMDGNVSFRYFIEGRRMLSHHLQLHELTMQDMYACLLAVADALDACKSYLLRPECCLLQDSCLFVGERWDDVYLLYVPVRNPDDEARQAVEGAGAFTALVMRLAAQVQELDGSGLQLVLRQLQDSRGVRPALRKALLQLLEGETNRPSGSSVTFEPDTHVPRRPQDDQGQRSPQAYNGNRDSPILDRYPRQRDIFRLQLDQEAGQLLPMQEQQEQHLGGRKGKQEQQLQDEWIRKQRTEAPPVQSLSQFQARLSSDKLQAREASGYGSLHNRSARLNPSAALALESSAEANGNSLHTSDNDGPLRPERSRWIVSAAAAIVAALVWRYGYLTDPSSNRLLISLGATVIIAAAVYIAGWRGSSRMGTMLEDSGPLNSRIHDGSVSQPLHWSLESRLLDRREANTPVPAERRSVMSSVSAVHGGAGNRNGPLAQGGDSGAIIHHSIDELPSASEATVWIGQESKCRVEDTARTGKIAWQLERSVRGRNERLKLPFTDDAAYLIGRTGGKVHYADEHPGISRVHLEFGSGAEGITVKDLGSRNGTTLNGNPMIAYKLYNLKSEDELQLAGNDGPVYTIRQAQEAAGV